jgi:hypothetical protein
VHNLLNIPLLISAILTCLAVGVVAAYGLCNLLFLAMRPRAIGAVAAPVAPKIAGAA